jgi:hypothetical protein
MLLQYFHDTPLAGHLGAQKSFYKVAANFWWLKMRDDIFQYVRKCHLCQRAKQAQNTCVGLNNAEPPARPMDKVFIDFVGPLTRTKRGNSAILAILDGFSKFVVFYPVRKISAQVVVDYLKRNYFPAFGTQNNIVSDNAKVFRSKQFRHLCFRWGVNHITTTPYYLQASLVERANRNLKAALKIFHNVPQNVWDEDLPWNSAAFNTAQHDSTNLTPDVLFLGREIKSPLEARWELPLKNEGNDTPLTQPVWTQAYRNLRLARNKVARRYNEKRTPHSFKAGDQVLYRKNVVSSKALNVSRKMQL